MVGVTGSNTKSFVKTGAMSFAAVESTGSDPESAPPLTTRGCAEGTTTAALSPDKLAMTVTFNDLEARVGPGIPAADATVVCELNLVLTIPDGYTYAISKMDFRGYAKLPAGSIGAHIAAQGVLGQQLEATATLLPGPLEREWSSTAVPEEPVYAPCDRSPTLNLQTVLYISGGGAENTREINYLTMDSNDASFVSRYHVSWATCD
jgi:hypothetical protein